MLAILSLVSGLFLGVMDINSRSNSLPCAMNTSCSSHVSSQHGTPGNVRDD